jgi:antitoxin component YwqK of YwqJK toxin-antitoxin module
MAFAILTIGCGEKKSDGVNFDELEDREGVFYLKSSNSPYTGKVFEFHENGQKGAEVNFKDGKVDGLVVNWDENGQKEMEVNFKDGKQHGLAFEWHENGQKQAEVTWKDGKQNGLAHLYYENGKKEREANFKDGKQHGDARGWHENGQKAFESECKNEKLVTVKAWLPDGSDCPDTNVQDGNGIWVYYDGVGEQEVEANYKDGKQHGDTRGWYENGQKAFESERKDGEQHGDARGWYENGQKAFEDEWEDGKLVTSKVWLLNGSDCPDTNVQDGTGTMVTYDKDGKESSRDEFKNGIKVSE